MKVNGRGLLIILLFIGYLPARGQTDTSKVAKQGSLDFMSLNEKFKERKSMFYFVGCAGISNPNGENIVDNGFVFGYEYKPWKKHLFGVGAGFFLQENRKFNVGSDKLLRINLSYKWLYNLDNRMTNGKTGNNLSANYIALTPLFTFGYSAYENSGYAWDFTRGEWAILYTRKSISSGNLKIGYGIQRLIRDRMLIDIQAGIMVTKIPFPSAYDYLYGQISAGFIIK
jgi:hypothetical protein